METIMGIVLAVAVAVERLTEVVKPLYLKVKNIITKRQDVDCTKTEKIVLAIIIGIVVSVLSGISLGITTVPILAQQVMVGLFASLGSGVIHTMINLLIAFKDAAEDIKVQK